MITLNIELQPHIEKSLQYLISRQRDVEHFFEDFILYKVSQLEKAIFNIEKDLRKYEQKHNLSSHEFYKKFESGKLGDDDDYMIWSGIYEMLLENKTELKEIQW